ncbi:MAG TPA: hypothetical protein VJS90_00115 [Pseudomonas sp.]|uniref:hypothetical protein n=1 Tax=Pseudomonas sp. TaxID=306 RepID=UPI002B483DC0|nr:hypothetical protein [Pseudomonas sp.]HKS11418.1 hypothetical protein [Pseudomonas sp.]
MQNPITPQQSGSIIVTNPDGKFLALNIPTDGQGKTFTLDASKLGKPRKIQMDDLPSAAKITLSGRGGWSFTLKTMHQPSRLSNHDLHYFVNTYLAADYIKEGLGIEVISKQGMANPDSLTTVKVEVSPRAPTL